MGWFYPEAFLARRRRRRDALRLEAAIVGATVAVVFLIFQPQGLRDLDFGVVADLTTPSSGPLIEGRASVIDGDGLRLDGHEIRLNGIDAFELHQACDGRPCGSSARAALSDLVSSETVACRRLDTDRYGRTIATCRAGGRDLGAEMVRSGHALAYRRYSNAYVDDEAQARRAGAGAWSGRFETPEDWRRSHPRG